MIGKSSIPWNCYKSIFENSIWSISESNTTTCLNMLFWFSIKAQSFTGLISMACFMWEAWICEVFKTCLKLLAIIEWNQRVSGISNGRVYNLWKWTNWVNDSAFFRKKIDIFQHRFLFSSSPNRLSKIDISFLIPNEISSVT